MRELSMHQASLVGGGDAGDATVGAMGAGGTLGYVMGAGELGASLGVWGGPVGAAAGAVVGGLIGFAVYKLVMS